MPNSVTLEQIARHLGLSKASVSVALRGRPGVSAEVRERVRKAAEKLGYSQNPLLGIHMAHVRNSRPADYQATLGWINTFRSMGSMLAIPIFREYFEGACEQAARLGFKVEEFCLHEQEMGAEQLNRVLRARNIVGLLVGPQEMAGGRIDLDWKHFSAVTFGYSLMSPRLHLVTNHHYRTLQDMLWKLRELGYKRVGTVINLENNARVNRAWTSVFQDDYHQQPRGARLKALYFHEVENRLTPAMVMEWMREERPDAIIAEDYVPPIHEGLRRLGLEPGRDVALALRSVARDDEFHAGMHQNERLIGAAAVDFLVGMLHRNECGIPVVPQRLLVESTWRSAPSVNERGPGVAR